MKDKPIALVVEDAPEQRQLVSALFHYVGFNVVIAGDGESAIELARKNAPKIICLDLMLPTISGLEVCRQLKSLPETAHVPVMMVSARQYPQDRAAASQLGADAYVTKPLDKDEFLACVRSLLWRKRVQ